MSYHVDAVCLLDMKLTRTMTIASGKKIWAAQVRISPSLWLAWDLLAQDHCQSNHTRRLTHRERHRSIPTSQQTVKTSINREHGDEDGNSIHKVQSLS